MQTHNSLLRSFSLLLTMLSVILTACQDEEFGYDVTDVRSSVYARHFTEVFGEADPNHTWSMAQNVKIDVYVPNATGYTLRILTETPTNRESIILYQGKMESDAIEVNVDVISGTQYLYIELSSTFGTYLVDGYYSIDEEGYVRVNKGMTRAAVGPASLQRNVYQTVLWRWARYWNDAKAEPSPYIWNYGFDASRINHLFSKKDVVPEGWIIKYNGAERRSGESHDNGTRSIQSTGSYVMLNGTERIDLPYYIVMQRPSSQEASVSYGYVDGYRFYAQGQTKLHLPLACFQADKNQFNITLQEKDNNGNWVNAKSETKSISNTYSNTNNITFQDIVFEYNFDVNKEYRISIALADAYTSGTTYAVFGGIIVECPSWANAPYREVVDNGTVVYRDVRGGSMPVYSTIGSQIYELRNEKTYRNRPYGTTHFNYRTFNVSKLEDAEGKSYVGGGYIGTFHIIGDGTGNDILEDTEEIKYRDQFPLYGFYKSTKDGSWTDSPFREGVNHIDPYFSDGSFNTPTRTEMQKEAQLVTLGRMMVGDQEYDGSVTAKLVGIGTGFGNDVGYFYYRKSDEGTLMRNLDTGEKALDFNKVPKIIIRKNMQQALTGMQPSQNFTSKEDMVNWGLMPTQFSRYVDGCSVLAMSDADFTSLKNSGKFNRYADNEYGLKTFIDDSRWNDATKRQIAMNATFTAPIYKLPYFEIDEKYEFTGNSSYEWPKDMVIGFFGIRTDASTASELARIYTSSASVQRNYFNDLPRGSAFSYKGKNYIGLEDEWDYDNNDFLFEVQGVQSVDPDITPDDDPVTQKTTQDWIIACEDLGGVWDYDFNDLVWAISKEVSSTTQHTSKGDLNWGTTDLYFTALAAGGTLHAVVEYNTSVALTPSDDNWSEDNWIPLGEIHQLVSRNINAKTEEEGAQINVTPGQSVTQIGERIKLGTTIPTASNDISIASILSHFRIRVKGRDGEYVVTNVTQQGSSNHQGHHSHIDGSSATNTPQFLLLPKGWAWPAEGVCITDVYGLTNWIQDQNKNWYWDWRNSNANHTGQYIINPLQP